MEINDRFKDAPWVTNKTIIIGGVGGIGSWLALFLSRIGYTIYLYDDDIFETHNMGGQFVSSDKIGMSKVISIKKLCNDFGANPRNIFTYNEKYTTNSQAHTYMISAFDNMDARKAMFNNWFKYNSEAKNDNALFIDGRLLFEQMQIFCVGARDTKKFREDYLFNDSEVPDAKCTMKQTSHSAAMIASFMTGFFTNHIANLHAGNKARTVPFSFEYYIPLNMFSDASI